MMETDRPYMTDIGLQRLQEGLDYVTENPEDWNQNTWIEAFPPGDDDPREILVGDEAIAWSEGACGTSACLAGWIALLAPEIETAQPVYDSRTGNTYIDLACVGDPNGDERFVSEAVFTLLTGYDNADDEGAGPASKFYGLMTAGTNNLPALWFYGQELAQGRLNVPEGITPCRR
jgi:hypothetical protein